MKTTLKFALVLLATSLCIIACPVDEDDTVTGKKNRPELLNENFTSPLTTLSLNKQRAVSPDSAAACCAESGEEAQFAIDGDPRSSKWHSKYTGSTCVKHWITFDLGDSIESIGGLNYLRRNGYPNGSIGKYEIYISDVNDLDANPPASKKVAEGEFGDWDKQWDTYSPNNWKSADILPPREGRYLQLRVISSVGGFAAVQELEYYQVFGVSGFSGIDKSYLQQAYDKGTELYAAAENPQLAWYKKLNTQLNAANALLTKETPGDVFEQIVYQKEIDAAAAPLIRSVNDILEGL